MTFDDFVRTHRNTLLGYHLLHEWFPGRCHIALPSPLSALSHGDLEELKHRLNACMPLQSFIVDLWDWDVHFEDDLGEEWYFEAAFGSTESLPHCASELGAFFLEQVERYDLDYNQYEDPEFFTVVVREETQQFIKHWRDNIFKRFAPPADGVEDV